MIFFIVAIIINWIAAFFDGFTTQQCIKAGYIEGNKVLDWIYRTNKPTALQEYGIGGAIELAEVGLYLLLIHFGFPFWVPIILLLVEAGVHVACAFSNHQLATTGKALFTL